MIELERSGAPKEEIEKLGTGSLRLAVVEGDTERGSFMSGQVAAMVNDEKTTKEILEYLMNDLKTWSRTIKKKTRKLEHLIFFLVFAIFYILCYTFLDG